MDISSKLDILGMAAKYDASCSSSGSGRPNTAGGIGNAARAGICHSWSDDGRCISLLKILQTNRCIYDCAYCVNRSSNDVPRAVFSPEEVADLTINFYRRNYIEGLLLSSGIWKSPDYTMELLIRTVKLLRQERRFNGYIHLKVMPGADERLIREAGLFADRLSANIELPTSRSLALLAPDKIGKTIMSTVKRISHAVRETGIERRTSRKAPSFAPAGQSTQIIIGASPDPDLTVLALSQALYRRLALRRVYYSAFMPVSKDTRLPALPAPPLVREHRLYQADWLLRFYGFSADELVSAEQPDLPLDMDPKAAWALANLDRFPVDVNRADYETLLRVPGLGVLSARRIIAARKYNRLGPDSLKKMGVVLKRARHFLTFEERSFRSPSLDPVILRQALTDVRPPEERYRDRQLLLFGNDASELLSIGQSRQEL